MKHYQIVSELEKTPGTKDKEQVLLKAFMSGNREFFLGARLAYDPLITFGVKAVPAIADEDLTDEPGTFSFSDFIVLTNKLRKRELTGHAAKQAIDDAALSCHGPSWNLFYRRVLRKDLQCGCTDTLINKVLKKLSDPEAENLIIPLFECQLAHDGEKDVHKSKVKGKKLLDSKWDGMRLLTVLDKELGTIRQYSRNGIENTNFQNITDVLLPLLESFPASVVLDGEVISENFQKLMTQANRKENVDTSDSKLVLFDIIPLNDFRKGICKISQLDRHTILSELEINGLSKMTNGLVCVEPKLLVDLDTEEGKVAFNEFSKNCLEKGLEGIMVKDPDAPYECKRSTAWLKIKPYITVDLVLVGMEEGKTDSKYVGMLGAMIFEGEDRGCKIRVNVGSGITDEQRIDFWNNQEKILGSIGEIKADCLTLERGSDVYSLRFPRFLRFRDIAPGEGKI